MLLRSYAALRDAETTGDGRTLTLALVPFDVPAWVEDDEAVGPYRESFKRGAFTHVLRAPNRVELRYDHDRNGPPYGFGQSLREDADMLVGDFRVAPSAAGDQALALVNDGQLRGVSIGFFPGIDKPGRDADGPLIERVRVKKLAEVSLTTAGSYEDAGVLAVRAAAAANTLADVERERLWWTRVRTRTL